MSFRCLSPRATVQTVHLSLAKRLAFCIVLLLGIELLPFTPALALLPCPFLDDYTQILICRIVGLASLVNTQTLYLSMLTQLFVHFVNASIKLQSTCYWTIFLSTNTLVFYYFLSFEQFLAASLATFVVLLETYKEAEFNEVYHDFVSAKDRAEVMLLEIFTIWSVFHSAPLAIESFRGDGSELYMLGAILGSHWRHRLISH